MTRLCHVGLPPPPTPSFTASHSLVPADLICLILGTPSILFSNMTFLSVEGTGQGMVASSPVGHLKDGKYFNFYSISNFVHCRPTWWAC